jgi:hypothetical protein
MASMANTTVAHKDSADSSIAARPAPHPRSLREFHDCYKRWSPQIFSFCFLVCGDREKAESITEQTLSLYFRCADCVAFSSCSEAPASLLRFASELAEIHCLQPLRSHPRGRTQALLALPFKERAVFSLISILRVERSLAAVALGLRSDQLAEYWLRAALQLRRFWLRSDQSRERGREFTVIFGRTAA